MERFLAWTILGGVSYLGAELISIIIRRIDTHVCDSVALAGGTVAAESRRAERIVWAWLFSTLKLDRPHRVGRVESPGQVPRGGWSGGHHCGTARLGGLGIREGLDPPRIRTSLQHHTNCQCQCHHPAQRELFLSPKRRCQPREGFAL
jgi:hypothetical protein